MSKTFQVAKTGASSLSKLLLLTSASLLLLRLLRARKALDFRGRVVVISGGSRGLGLNLARQLARGGAKLALIARDAAELELARQEIAALGAPCFVVAADICDESAAKSAIDSIAVHYGAIDGLINNAGVMQIGPLQHMNDADFRAAMELHFWAPWWLCRAATPHLKASGNGRIVNIASVGGRIAAPHMAPYIASKFALVGLSDAMRNELGTQKILVTTVCPGPMRTGSHVQIGFKGQRKSEYRILKFLLAMPGGAIEVDAAAKIILDAMRHGDPHVTFPFPIHLAALSCAIFPNLAGSLIRFITQFAPQPTSEFGDSTVTGHDLESAAPPSRWTHLADRAVAANNETLRGKSQKPATR
ncbi:SDR family NAD(P)-dependent oxidoreductase [Abditibacterium utsteinense]|nr:SDR family oxidoreductase [Abditibacterium utsteinense]